MRLVGRAGCYLLRGFFLVFNLLQLCFPSPLCQGISIQVNERWERLGESRHGHGHGSYAGPDFVALVSFPISPMDVIEKPKYSIGQKRSEF